MSPWTGPAATLADRVAAFIAARMAGGPTESFAALARDVHAWQVTTAPVVAALVEGPIADWRDIPAVPVDLYKELPVGTLAADEPAITFRTSGTTGGARGIHRMRSSALYDLGAVAWARRCVPGLPTDTAALLQDSATVPDSSLSHMVAAIGAGSWHMRDGELDRSGLDARVAAAPGPLFMPGTAFALAEWLDGDPAPLPAGSVVMVTGGFKGREHRLEGAELLRACRDQLRPARLVTEYGMTELSSQLWGTPEGPFWPAPWLRAVAVDPHTGTPLPADTEGQLRFYDLCNLDASIGVETLDAGRVRADGAVSLSGRLAGSPARGCSLTVEEAWARRTP